MSTISNDFYSRTTIFFMNCHLEDFLFVIWYILYCISYVYVRVYLFGSFFEIPKHLAGRKGE